MATATMTKRNAAPAQQPQTHAAPIPRALRQQAEAYLALSYPFMDSPTFKQRGIEKDLFNFEHEPQLPMTSWYQPTREDLLNSAITGAPQLMSASEEKLMFLRFNFS